MAVLHHPLVPPEAGLVRGAECAEGGCFFWRIGERPRTTWDSGFTPILQKPSNLFTLNAPKRLETSPLHCDFSEIKKRILFKLSVSPW
jgi:hypothetical protein